MNTVMEIETGNTAVLALFSENTREIFEEEVDIEPVDIKEGYLPYVPWGSDNELPYQILEKLRKSEVMNSNNKFNVQAGYGLGISIEMEDGVELPTDVYDFFEDNDSVLYWMEQQTDMKHFNLAFCELILSGDGKKIVQLNHLEGIYCRFETANPQNGKIEHIFYANWANDPGGKDVVAIPLLDIRNPYTSLLKWLEKNPRQRKFAMAIKLPIPGRKYYPFPYYFSAFNSGWYDLSTLIPVAKKAMMANGMRIRFIIEMHHEYFQKIYEEENITTPDKMVTRKTLELTNIKNFLSGAENAGKTWFSKFYIDPNGKEQPMVRITRIENGKEGGDYIEDAEEASNFLCYAQGVHPSLIGAVPGKNKGSFSGTDKRELFTMKQTMEKPERDLLLKPYKLIKRFNNWDKRVKITVPHLMLTTLDKGSDAKEVNNNNTDDGNTNN